MENVQSQLAETTIPQNEFTEKFMAEQEMCAFLGINKAQLSRIRRSSGLPFVKITKYRRLYPVDELVAWMSGRVVSLNQGDINEK